MGACTTCTHKNSYESTFKDFWEKLKIRNIPQSDWNFICKNNKDLKVTKKINEPKWENIMRNNLANEENSELSSNIFRKAMALSEERGGQYFLLTSILFLCPKNSLITKKEFEDMCKIGFNLKNEFKNENDILWMKKKCLEEIIYFYVNLISLFVVDKLNQNVGTQKKDFEDQLYSMYSFSNQKSFLEEEIFGKVEEEWVNLDLFFEKAYPILQNDSLVRERLGLWAEKNSQVTVIRI